jgi:hypothetical protein
LVEPSDTLFACAGDYSNGQALAYVYGHAEPRDAGIAKSLTLDEARRIASNIAKLPKLLAS